MQGEHITMSKASTVSSTSASQPVHVIVRVQKGDVIHLNDPVFSTVNPQASKFMLVTNNYANAAEFVGIAVSSSVGNDRITVAVAGVITTHVLMDNADKKIGKRLHFHGPNTEPWTNRAKYNPPSLVPNQDGYLIYLHEDPPPGAHFTSYVSHRFLLDKSRMGRTRRRQTIAIYAQRALIARAAADTARRALARQTAQNAAAARATAAAVQAAADAAAAQVAQDAAVLAAAAAAQAATDADAANQAAADQAAAEATAAQALAAQATLDAQAADAQAQQQRVLMATIAQEAALRAEVRMRAADDAARRSVVHPSFLSPVPGIGSPLTDLTHSSLTTPVPGIGSPLTDLTDPSFTSPVPGINILRRADSMTSDGSSEILIADSYYGTPGTSDDGSASSVGTSSSLPPAELMYNYAPDGEPDDLPLNYIGFKLNDDFFNDIVSNTHEIVGQYTATEGETISASDFILKLNEQKGFMTETGTDVKLFGMKVLGFKRKDKPLFPLIGGWHRTHEELEALMQAKHFSVGQFNTKGLTPWHADKVMADGDFVWFKEMGIVTAAAYKTIGNSAGSTGRGKAVTLAREGIFLEAQYESTVPIPLRWLYQPLITTAEEKQETKTNKSVAAGGKRKISTYQLRTQAVQKKNTTPDTISYPMGYLPKIAGAKTDYTNKSRAFADLLVQLWHQSKPNNLFRFAATTSEHRGELLRKKDGTVLAKTLYHPATYKQSDGTQSWYQPSWNSSVLDALGGGYVAEPFVKSTQPGVEFTAANEFHQTALKAMLHIMLFEHCVQITQMELIRRRAGGAKPGDTHQKTKTGEGKLPPNVGKKGSTKSQPNDKDTNTNPIPAMVGVQWDNRITETIKMHHKTELRLIKYLESPNSEQILFARYIQKIEDHKQLNTEAAPLVPEGIGRTLITGM